MELALIEWFLQVDLKCCGGSFYSILCVFGWATNWNLYFFLDSLNPENLKLVVLLGLFRTLTSGVEGWRKILGSFEGALVDGLHSWNAGSKSQFLKLGFSFRDQNGNLWNFVLYSQNLELGLSSRNTNSSIN